MDISKKFEKFRQNFIGFRGELDREIEFEIMKSDRARSIILALVFFILTLILLFFTLKFPIFRKPNALGQLL